MSALRFVIDSDENATPLHAVAAGPSWNGWARPIVTEDQLREWVEAYGMADEWPIVVQDGALVLHRTDVAGEVDPDEGREVWAETSPGSGLYALDGWTWVGDPECVCADYCFTQDGSHAEYCPA